MATQSSIEWTELTWNPVTGCTKVSDGCKNCYAERMAKRLQAMGNPRYLHGFRPTLHEDLLDFPKTLRRSRLIFVNSMSDLFHEQISDEFIQRVFFTMNECPQHTFQVLTKRTDRLATMAKTVHWTPNIWMGTSVEDDRVIERIDLLRQVPASIRFLSCEPLLGPLRRLELTGVHWVIVGGESGPRARPMDEAWVLEIERQCRSANVAFFFKQWGGVRKDKTGRLLQGRTFDQFPTANRNATCTEVS